jgi:NTP pyrophosphatase (non-canonical NTP hydrolase)
MNFNEYQIHARRTANVEASFEDQLANYAMGASGESGEMLDAVKKRLYQGHSLDDYRLAKEIGDTMWYLANIANLIGFDLEMVAKMNIEKLKKRYPNGFNKEDSINRMDV